MARCLSRVTAILRLADSKKVTERKSFLQSMLDVYTDDEFVAAINEVTAQKFDGPTSWNEIMTTVHRLILSEAEKPLGKTGRSGAAEILQNCCCAVMLKTVHLAMNTTTMSLSCDDLMAMIFQILDNKIFELFQETYINVLDHVLTNKLYRMEISSEQWTEVLRLSTRMYRHNSNTFKSVVLDTVRLTVQYGCLQSHLVLDVERMIPFLETIFDEIVPGREMMLKPVYKLTHVVCQQIGTERRIALCEFSEKCLPHIVPLEGCPEKYDMMLLLVRIHHPGGASTNDDAAYACDWDLWKNIIKGIHANIIRDLKPEKLSPCVLKLACEVYRQIMQDSSYATSDSSICPDEEYTQPLKRRRLSMAVQKPIDMLTDTNLDIVWPSVQILTVLMKKYPNSLKSNDYEAFLKAVMDHVTASLNKEKVMNSLCELCTVLVRVEKEHFHEINQTDTIGTYWEKIWDTVLRALSMNQNEILGHELLQSIIEHRNVLNPTAFLRLYLTNAIRWSTSSVETLLSFCRYVPVPSEFPNSSGGSARPEFSIRESLVRWAQDIPSPQLFTQIPSVTLANLLTGLTIKSWYKREFRDAENFYKSSFERKIADAEKLDRDLFDDRESKALNDIERCHLALEFRQNLFAEPDKSETDESEPAEAKIRTFCIPEILESLVTSTINSQNDRPTEDNIGIFIKRITVVAKLLSNFAELNVPADSQIARLASLFSQTFRKMMDLLITIDTARCPYLVHIVVALEALYCTRYHRKVGEMIVTSSSMAFMKFIYELIPEDDDDESPRNDENSQSLYVRSRRFNDRMSISSKNDLSDSCRLKNAAHKILTYYCCAWIGQNITISQTRVLKNIMKVDIYEEWSIADLRRALTLLKVFGSSEKQLSTSDECLDMSIAFLEQVYVLRQTDETAVRGILNILPHLAKVAFRLNHQVDDLTSVLSSIHKRLINGTPMFGPLVQADFVKCLADIIRLDSLMKWKLNKSAEITPIINVLPEYVVNPFYLVRLEVVRALQIVFSSKDLQVPWKLEYFAKIQSAIANLFVIDEMPDSSEKTDEMLTRTITAVHIYVAIIHASEVLHSRALLAVFELSGRYNATTATLKKALLSVTRNENEQRRLVEINLHYLLSHWFEADYPLQNFPCALLDCASLEDFSKKHIETLLLIKLERREFHQLQILCNNIDVNFVETVENCFPSIVALLLSMKTADALEETYGRQMYHSLRSNTGDFGRVRSFDDLLQEKLSDVIVDIVKRLHDQEHFHTLFKLRVFLPRLNPPNFNTETVHRCLRYLEDDLRVDGTSIIEYLTTRRQSVLQKILLTLICNIYEVDGVDYKLQAFYQYAFFYTAVIEELSSSCFDSMAVYVVRDITHSLLALMKEEIEPLSETACTFFRLFLSKSLPTRATEIKQILSFTVSSLIPIIQAGKVPGAMSVLRFLIVDQQQVLSDAIEKLDSFPSEDSFSDIKQVHHSLKYGDDRSYSLDDEIEHFLNATQGKTLSCSLEGLSHVRNQLSTRKSELRDMYGKLEGLRGFAEDCARSTLHKLVYKLVQLTRSSDPDVSLEAAKCLGELGPADLTTMILHPENGYYKEDTHDEVTMLTFKAVGHLADYLIENNMGLRRASSDALYAIFSTSWGHGLFMRKLLPDEFARTHEHVYPFGIRKSSRAKPIYINRNNWQGCTDKIDDLWIPASYAAYPKWIIEITCRLLDCFVNLYAASLKPVCRFSVEFCEFLLPRLVNLITRTDAELVGDVCVVVNRFFGSLSESINETDQSMIVPDSPVKRDVAHSYECVRCMLNVVNFMRIQSTDNALLAFNYLLIAKAAQYCSAYFTSVLYAELWCEGLLQESGLLMDKVPGSWISAIDAICESKPDTGKLLQDIVREAYLHIGDPDSIYGCGLSHLIDSSYRTQHYIHLRQWDKVMLAQDVELSCGNAATRGMLNALQQSGLQYLLGRMMNTANKEIEDVDDFMYEAAWRLSDWSIIEPHRVVDSTSENSAGPQNVRSADYYAFHYRALKCLFDSDIVGLKNAVDKGRASIVKSLRNMSLECSQTVYPILSQLQLLREIEEFATNKPDKYEALFDVWHQQDFDNTHNFQYVEPILSQRLVMFRTKNSGGMAVTMNRALIKTHLEIADVAEKQGYFSIAARSLDTLTKTNDLSSGARDQSTYQEAVLAWKRNDQDIGRYLLRNLIKKTTIDPSLRAKILRIYGNWMAETKSENSQAVIQKYYQESIKTSGSIKKRSTYDVNNLTDAQADLAQFADAQYQQIIDFMKSPQYESLVECSKLQNDISSRSAPEKGTVEVRRAVITNQKQMINDAAELEDINREKEMYLGLAARYYLLALQNDDRHDLLIFRLVSLWLDNMLHDELNEILAESLDRVASYKFITLLPQLGPHMSNERNDFTVKINNLMERCAKEHPHHTLPVLFSLKNTYKDHEYQPPEQGSQKRKDKTQPEARIVAAERLLNELADTAIRPIIQEMSQLSHALIMLAYCAISEAQAKKVGQSHNIPKSQMITRVRNYEHINVPTMTLNVSPNGNYKYAIGIREYKHTFEIPGGVCAPKKVICVGTDGISRKQLVKGRDDLRQDAVMQQVCTVMNTMLKASKETKRRKLHIRTYKIVPLSQRSGVLEWCENTLPISNVLCDSVGKKGLHSKYYPDDWTVQTCRMNLRGVDKASAELKLKTFLECCKHLHPAFHHFFMENYPSAETWFERRLAYTRSVATTSMVGYMLGLGDRHFSNILIDQTTAEVIHIDFGIAFAQGKVLPIPETVPFRLTRDMEVAMGICGVEGVMRRSCEETVTVLRDRRKILITLLQVLLYDPLFSWTITPVKSEESNSTARYGGHVAGETSPKKMNQVAKRALLRIEQKLQGTEDGRVSSISGQVERLIQQARDPINLCRLYSGWQAYL